ncbi:N-acetylmuramoyl-L-alanine amidase [Paludibacterium denitrificans]|uniref:MurNAc-LAA domain-containing protein n=1 Tax=Paludibacterium denitrificans TaxID=2675226 RepID=A0A844GDY3_9NEIS|nr:N-acetylmuramoyl-L-alanine amidase [Paludibacterium denitrificans]MTD33859.1 hypothetical protein [Paludibacterium denitrificans]
MKPPLCITMRRLLSENRPLADAALGVYWFDDLVVLRTARQPVLVEHGVIVNAQEEKRLADPAVERKLAEAVADGIQACLPALPLR